MIIAFAGCLTGKIFPFGKALNMDAKLLNTDAKDFQ